MASASTNNSERIKATNRNFTAEWKIPDFFPLEERYKEGVTMPEFQYLGAKWSVEFLKLDRFWEIFLARRTFGTSVVWAYYTIGIKKIDGTVYKSARGKRNVGVSDDSKRTKHFLLTSDLQRDKMEIAPQNFLVIFCNIDMKEKHEETAINSSIQADSFKGINELEKDLRNLFISEEDSDVALNVGNRVFRAHKAILRARSPVFFSMFRHDMKERDSGNVDIIDCDPKAFEQFLLYLYTGKVDSLTPENVCHLFEMAEKYGVTGLKRKCILSMNECLSTDNFCDVARFVLLYNDLELIDIITQFFQKNAKKIVVSCKWLIFLKEKSVEANELIIKILNFAYPD